MRPFALVLVAALLVAACAEGVDPPASVEPGPPLAALDLQVQNSGMPGGYLWLSMADQRQTGRWHRFGMAEFLCVTCPRPFTGAGAGYEIVVFDEACALQARFRTLGGPLQVAIDLGPTITLVPAPPLGDWMPGDSAPTDPGTVPCPPP